MFINRPGETKKSRTRRENAGTTLFWGFQIPSKFSKKRWNSARI